MVRKEAKEALHTCEQTMPAWHAHPQTEEP